MASGCPRAAGGRAAGCRRRCARDDAGPPAAGGDVLVVVDGRAGAHLDAGLGEVEREDGGGGELLAGRGAGVVPRAGRDVLGDGAQPGEALGVVGDEPGPAVHHRAAVVHRVVEHRARVDDAVDVGDGDADRCARRPRAGCRRRWTRAGRACRPSRGRRRWAARPVRRRGRLRGGRPGRRRGRRTARRGRCGRGRRRGGRCCGRGGEGGAGTEASGPRAAIGVSGIGSRSPVQRGPRGGILRGPFRVDARGHSWTCRRWCWTGTARSPLAVQLADALRAAARAGAVRVGDRLPSTRSLAADARGEPDGDRRGLRPAARRGLGGGAARRGDVRGGGAGRAAGTRARHRRRHRPCPDRRGTAPHGRPAGRDALRRGAGPRPRGGGPGAPPPTSRPTSCPTPSACRRSGAAVVEHLLRHRGLAADPGAVLATGGTTAAVAELARAAAAAGRGSRWRSRDTSARSRRCGPPGSPCCRCRWTATGLVVDALPAGPRGRLLHAGAPVPARRAAVGGAPGRAGGAGPGRGVPGGRGRLRRRAALRRRPAAAARRARARTSSCTWAPRASC